MAQKQAAKRKPWRIESPLLRCLYKPYRFLTRSFGEDDDYKISEVKDMRQCLLIVLMIAALANGLISIVFAARAFSQYKYVQTHVQYTAQYPSVHAPVTRLQRVPYADACPAGYVNVGEREQPEEPESCFDANSRTIQPAPCANSGEVTIIPALPQQTNPYFVPPQDDAQTQDEGAASAKTTASPKLATKYRVCAQFYGQNGDESQQQFAFFENAPKLGPNGAQCASGLKQCTSSDGKAVLWCVPQHADCPLDIKALRPEWGPAQSHQACLIHAPEVTSVPEALQRIADETHVRDGQIHTGDRFSLTVSAPYVGEDVVYGEYVYANYEAVPLEVLSVTAPRIQLYFTATCDNPAVRDLVAALRKMTKNSKNGMRQVIGESQVPVLALGVLVVALSVYFVVMDSHFVFLKQSLPCCDSQDVNASYLQYAWKRNVLACCAMAAAAGVAFYAYTRADEHTKRLESDYFYASDIAEVCGGTVTADLQRAMCTLNDRLKDMRTDDLVVAASNAILLVTLLLNALVKLVYACWHRGKRIVQFKEDMDSLSE